MNRVIEIDERMYQRGDVIVTDESVTIFLWGFGREQVFGIQLTKDYRIDHRLRRNEDGWSVTITFNQLVKSEIVRQGMSIQDIEQGKLTENGRVNAMNSRKVTSEEAKKYGIKTVLNEVDWFVDPILQTVATIGITNAGISFNPLAASDIGITEGDYVEVGFAGGKVVLRKNERGLKLKQSKDCKSLLLSNQRLAKWFQAKNVKNQRYAITYDETSEVWTAEIETLTA